jgi:outer membrane protein insertion porin family
MVLQALAAVVFLAVVLMPGKDAVQAREAPVEGLPVVDVVVIGNDKVADSTILNAMQVKPGQPFSGVQLDADLKAIYALGFFDNVLMNATLADGGVTVAVVVVEKPTVAGIVIRGNNKIERKDLLKEITVRTFAILNREKITESEEKIRAFYRDKGFFSIAVRSKVVPAGKQRVKVVFDIDEGRKSYIRKIRFSGNENFTDWRLRRQMQTKEYNLFLTWLTDAGILKQEQLNNDVKLIKSFYLSKGYVQARVSKPKITLSENKKWIYLDFEIEEGEVFTLGTVELVDPELADDKRERVLAALAGKPGEAFSNMNLREDIEKLTTWYGDQGYAFVDVDPRTRLRPDERQIDISYHITRGDQFHFGRIEIAGNTKTRDKVIRRELRFAEGDLYNTSALKRSRERLTNTQFFAEADIQTEPADDGTMDVRVKVEEGQTGSFSIGLGYSTVDSVIGMASIAKKNFLGRGWDVNFHVELSGTSSRYNIGITDPYFLDIPMTAGFAVFNEEIEYDAYDTKQTGFRIHIGKPIDEYTSWLAGYRLEQVEIFNIDDYASDYIWDEEGKTTTSQAYVTLIRDKRNNFLFPTRGYRLKGTVVLAGGPLGFDNDFYKVILEGHKFFPLKWDSALHLRGTFGYADGYGGQDLPLYERFYLGGMDTIRGFDFGEAGPEDENGDVIGGTSEVILSAEWVYPLVKSMGLHGVLFFDMGKAYDQDENLDLDLRQSVGFGVRWKSPMGPLRVEWGLNLSPEDDEKSAVWDFSVGQFF